MTLAKVFFILLATTVSISTAQNVTCSPICSPDLNKCYQYFVNLARFWEAENYCTTLGGHLASIHSQEENYFVQQIGLRIYQYYNYNYNYHYWIGGTLSDSGWKWTDGTPFNYTNWATNEPNRNCTTQRYDGLWISFFPRDIVSPFICSVPTGTQSTCPPTTTVIPTSSPAIPTTPSKQCVSCESGWTYFAATDSCYKVFHNAKWSEAEVQCVSYGAHLTSIHSDAENTFVNNLAACGIKEGDLSNLAWIGMHQVGEGWVWTDGTKSDYFKWASKQPDNPNKELCVQTAPDVSHNGWYLEWNNNVCTTDMRAYICKKSSIH